MASNGRCDGSTGGRALGDRRPDIELLVERRRFLKRLRPFAELEDFLLRLSAEPDVVLTKLREIELGAAAGVFLVASS